MSAEAPAYGLWSLVVINVAIFAMFAFSFTHPRTARDWRSFGAFTAFLVALFTGMYGFPLTIYLLAGWLQKRYPGLDLLSHNTGHLWETLLGAQGDPHLSPLHLLSGAGTEAVYKLYAESWKGWDHLRRIQEEAQAVIQTAFRVSGPAEPHPASSPIGRR